VTARLPRLLAALLRDPAAFGVRLRLALRLRGLRVRSRSASRPVTGDGAAVVNLTSYGHRIETVFYAIESIAAGTVRPRRLILWLDDPAVLADPPRPLRRLRSRGLELLYCPDYGPHKKQFAYASTVPSPVLPLVAADDDVLYPRRWLADLLAGYARYPGDVHAHRTHRVEFDGGSVAPYSRWSAGSGTRASFRTFCTGVSGILYPPALLTALAAEGTGFIGQAPWADDVWVHSVMLRHGFRGRQVAERQAEYPAVPGTQRGTLYGRNVRDGGNDAQIRACFGDAEVRRMLEDAGGPGSGPAAEPGNPAAPGSPVTASAVPGGDPDEPDHAR
jgi:hypothetical protein